MGAGKSVALEVLGRLGAVTLSTDAAVHEIYEDPEVVTEVVGRWGDDVAPGGVVDRAMIAKAAFADPDERAWLEQLIWPRVAVRVIAFRDEAQRREPPPRAAVVETPLLFEAGMDGGSAAADSAAATRSGGRDAVAVRGGDGRGLRRDDRRRRR